MGRAGFISLFLLFLPATAVEIADDEPQLGKILDEIYSLHFSSLKCLVVVDSKEEFGWLPPPPKPPKIPTPIVSVSLDADDVSALSQGPLSPDAAASILSEDSDDEWVPPPPSSFMPALRTLLSARTASCDAYVVFLSNATPDTGMSLVKDGPRSGLLHGTARLLLVLNSTGSSNLERVLPPTHALTRVAVVEGDSDSGGFSVKKRLPDGRWEGWKAGDVLFGSGSVPGDLGGRKLVMSTFPYPPFSFVKHDAAKEPTPGSVECGEDSDVPMSSLEGTEIRIIRELAHTLNFRPCAVLRPNSRWLNHSPNGSLQGVLADVSNSFADLGFAGFYQDAREAPLVDYSAPYTSAGLSFLVPRPRSPAVPRWMALLKPFTPWSWAAVGGTLAAAAMTIRLLASVATRVLPPPAPAAYARYVRLPDCVLHVASVLAQVGVPMPTGNEGRWPVQWLLPGLNLITYCYSGCLAAYLTLPSPEAPIDTLSELREAGLPWGARTAYWSLLLLHNWENPDAQVLGRRFRLIREPVALRRGLLSAEMAVAVQTVQGSYVTNAEYLDARGFAQVHLMKETAFEGYVSILLPKGSPLTRPSDKIIGRLLAAGLVQRWERDLTSSSSSPSTSSSLASTTSSSSPSPSSTPPPASPSNSGPVVLSLEHILGAFLLLFGGLIASSTTLAAEVLAAKHEGT